MYRHRVSSSVCGEVVLADKWRGEGVHPEDRSGHSSGEPETSWREGLRLLLDWYST